jgi:hypothetical protein
MEDILIKGTKPRYILYLSEKQYNDTFPNTCHCMAENSIMDIGLEQGDVEIRVRGRLDNTLL